MKNKKVLLGLFLVITIFTFGCKQGASLQESELSLQELCTKNGNMFMKMGPTIDGVPTGEPACAGCMVGASHYCNLEEYKNAIS